MLGDKVNLECIFDLEGEVLYSVKWYKGGKEFFRLLSDYQYVPDRNSNARYIPEDKKRIMTFSLPGIDVNVGCLLK